MVWWYCDSCQWVDCMVWWYCDSLMLVLWYCDSLLIVRWYGDDVVILANVQFTKHEICFLSARLHPPLPPGSCHVSSCSVPLYHCITMSCVIVYTISYIIVSLCHVSSYTMYQILSYHYVMCHGVNCLLYDCITM